MNFNHLDLNLLVALDALLAERNITRAGARLHLSQSAMSGALARLRTYFQDDLLVQVRREMVPTPLARHLRPRVRAILIEIQATVDARVDFDPKTSERHFRLAVSDYVLGVLSTSVLARLPREAPGITCEFLTHSEPPAASLERDKVDLLILPQEFLSPEHPSQVLFRDEFVCVVWDRNHTVADTLTIEQYLRLSHVAVRFGDLKRLGTCEEQALAAHGCGPRRIECITFDFNSAIQLIPGTQRITTTARRLAVQRAWSMPLRILPVPFNMPPLVEQLQWHSSRDQDPANRWLREFLSSAFRDTAAPATHGHPSQRDVSETIPLKTGRLRHA